MPRDDGLRSLRCCKRRSIISNLRGFGHKWSSSRQRIAILHLSPIRPDPYTTYSKTSSTSDLALAAAAGLSLQGHAVTMYTPGYKHRDIPDHFWDSSADIKSCLPRIVRLALFSNKSCAQSVSIINTVVALIITIRVIIHCIISIVTNLLWSLLPQVIQRARGGRTSVTSSVGTSIKLLDVIMTFDDHSPSSSLIYSIPLLLLSTFAKKIISFPAESVQSTDDLYRYTWCPEPDTYIATSDSQSLMLSHSTSAQIVTIYPPVISHNPDTMVKHSSVRDETHPSRPYFVALSWYRKNFEDLLIAIESFGVFIKSFDDQAFSSCDEKEDGCTGSFKSSVVMTSKRRLKPLLMVVDVRPEDKDLVLAEIARNRLQENVVVIPECLEESPSKVSNILNHCIGVIHTPTEVNEIRIPCASMLSSRPVITTMSFCLSEPVRHESTGVLVKTASPHLVAQGIEHVYSLYCSRNSEWVRMGQRGKQRVLTEFSVEMFGSRLDDVIEGCVVSSSRFASATSLRPRAFSSGSERGGRTLSVQSGLSELVAAASTTD